ncbi:MAG: Rrf2 family transcriptional regulator [Firmicutes bacterium]|nr:Rrf2 family transcriptional regulator [Bacillota bacterium]
MLPLSQSAGYAVLALSCLEDPGGSPVLVQDVAALTGAPGPYLAKLFSTLAKAGLVMAKRGNQGGVMLARPAKNIPLSELAEVLDGAGWRSNCLLGLMECSDERGCPVHTFWSAERARIHQELSAVTLADVTEFERKLRQAPSSPSRTSKRD